MTTAVDHSQRLQKTKHVCAHSESVYLFAMKNHKLTNNWVDYVYIFKQAFIHYFHKENFFLCTLYLAILFLSHLKNILFMIVNSFYKKAFNFIVKSTQ